MIGELTEPCVFCGRQSEDFVTCDHCGRSQTSTRHLWTPKMYQIMYTLLRKRFKNVKGWEAATPRIKKSIYKEIRNKLREIGANWVDVGGIEVQIRFAVARPTGVDNRQTPTFFKNKTYAHEAGFIGNDDLEVSLICNWK